MVNYFIDSEHSTTLEIKKSKFISYIFQYQDFKEILKKLQKKYPKARHFVWAYRYLNEFGQVVENCTDDGEPKNTSGRPTLKVLNGKNIIETAIITVRFFGGIKLGTGGLVKAYSDSANLVIENSNLIEYLKLEKKIIDVLYSDLSKIEYLIKNLNITIEKKEFNEKGVKLYLTAEKEKLQKIK